MFERVEDKKKAKERKTRNVSIGKLNRELFNKHLNLRTLFKKKTFFLNNVAIAKN